MNELLVGAESICKRFHISRTRLRAWEQSGAPVYRRGNGENAVCCADYNRLLDWEEYMCAKKRGRLALLQHTSSSIFLRREAEDD